MTQAEGSGTVRDVVMGINGYLNKGIEYEGRNRKGSSIWRNITHHAGTSSGILTSPVTLAIARPLRSSNTSLNRSVERLYSAVRASGIVAILIGGKRRDGYYFALFKSLLTNEHIGELEVAIINMHDNCSSDRKQYGSRNPFLIPIRH